MKKSFYFLVFLAGILNFIPIHAQLVVQGGYTAQDLAEILAGNNITVTNATLTGATAAAGSFDGSNSNLNVSSGVILSTGNITDAPGPNASSSTSTDLAINGTGQTDSLAGTSTYDAITLEFDFQVQSDMIQFNYVFASEEYPEYAPPNSSTYNDVFAFFISGPGITGEENIALVPNTTNPVSINNINAITNNQYYVDNAGGQTVEYDAFTTVLTAKRTNLIPCNTYHLKLVIADAGDHIYDSGVFLEENSLVQGIVNIQTQTVNGDGIALEGCIPAHFDFTLQQPLDHDYQINYTISGSATNGIDYQHIDDYVVIPQGQTTATIVINSIQDGFPEGQENIILIYQPEPCSAYDTVYLYIDDAQPIQFTLDQHDLTCYQDSSGQIFVDATGGFTPYSFYVTDIASGNTQIFNDDTINGLAAGTYSVQVYDTYGCKADALVIGGIFDADTTFLPDGSGVSYTSIIDISGFDAGETITDMSQLLQICANMEHSYLGDLQIKIIAPSGESVILKEFNGGGSCDLGEPVATGPIDGSAGSLITDPGNGFDYCFNATPDHGTMVSESQNYTHTYVDNLGHNLTDNYLPAGSYTSYEPLSNLLGAQKNGTWTMEVTDQYYLDNGYIFNWNISLTSDLPDTTSVINEPNGMTITGNTAPATCGNNNGAIDITVSGDYPPFSFLWSNGDTTEDISGIGAGTFTVTVSDANGCSQTVSYSLSNVSSLQTNANITNINCFGNTTGAIELNTSGGTTPYTFLWSNGATTEDISGLLVGTFTVTIIDNNGCQLIQSFDVTQNPDIVLTGTETNEYCGNVDGSIDLTPTGGSGSFAFNWNNGASTEDISGLNAGNYAVTVIDAFGCTDSAEYSIINDVTSCSTYCYLAIDNIQEVDDTCGSGQGAIDITIENATVPYSIQWSNGDTIEDLSGLIYGTYSVTVNDAAGCSATQDITVGNQTGTLAITGANIIDETCGNINGSIDISVSGGALPYTFSWSNSATTEDVSGLLADDYTVQVTDANNCLLSQVYTVNNNTGNMTVTDNITNEICGNNGGAINLTLSGTNGIVSFNWSNGAISEDLTNLQAGTYSVTIVDGSNCSYTNDYIVINTSGNMSVSSTVTNETCQQADGTIDITINGGVFPYTFTWSNGATTEDIFGLSQGTYSCTIVDNNGCQTSTGSQYVFNTGGSLTISTNYITDEICSNGFGAANIDVSGGDSNYVYLWSNGSTSQDLLNVHAGIYTITVTDGNNCSTTHTVTINNTSGTLHHDNTVVTNEICGDGQGAIDIYVSGGTTPYSFTWNTGATTEDLNNLSEGNYSCTVVDNNGCQIEITATVQNDASGMAFTQTVTNEICSNGQGGIDITVTGGSSPYTFSWSNSATTEDLTNISAGNYSCTITDDNGCELHTGNITVNNNPGTLSVSATTTDETCNNSQGAVDLTVTSGMPPYIFNWSNSETTEDIIGLTAGSYSYTVTDNSGCIVSGNVLIANIPGTLSIDSIVVDNEVCNNNNGAIDLTVSGATGNTYFIWSTGATTEDLTGLNEGNYTCTVTDDNSCEVVTGNITVANDAGTLQLTDVQTTDENCGNGLGSINITVSGGTAPLTYLWNNGATIEDISGLSAGIYICTITDSNNCSITAQATIQNNSGSLSVSDFVVTDEACSNGQGAIDITVQGGTVPYTFVWSNGTTTEDISGLSAGTYSCQITDNTGCSTLFSTTVNNAGSNLTISNVVIQNDVCGSNSGSVDITVSGGTNPIAYQWNTGDYTEDITDLTAGSYAVTVTDNNGCQVTDTYQVENETGTLSIDTLIVINETCGDINGSIDLVYSGGNLPVTIMWSNGATTEDINNLSAGAYYVTVVDQYGCSVEDMATVTNNSSGFSVNTIVTDEHCADSTGSIDLTVTGGQIPYTFYWNTGTTTEDLSNLSQGNYLCTITDNSGCHIYVNETVQNITNGLAITDVYLGDDHCNQNVGYINLVISGGVTPYSYAWSNGAVTEDLNNITAGDYSCTITDSSGCQVISGIYHIDNTTNNISVVPVIANDTCNLSTGAIQLTVSNGFAPYTYIWSTGDTTVSLGNLTTGTYDYTVTDATGCGFSSSENIVDVMDDNLQFASINIVDDTCNLSHGEISFQTVGSGYDYEFNGSPTISTTFTGLNEDDYQISLIENTCRVDTTVHLGNQASFSIPNYSTTNEQCGDGTGGIDMTIVPAGNYSYLWNNGQGTEDLTGVHAGTYSCTITNDQGCTDFFTATVNNIASFTVSGATTNENCGDASGSIDLTTSGTSGNVTYLWSNGDTTEDISGLAAGTYSVTVTDDNCAVTQSFAINNNTGILQVNGSVTDDFCDQGQGQIDQTITGSSGTYTVSWSSGDTTLSISNLHEGSYSVTVNDGGCIYINTYQVNNSGFFTVNHFVTHASCGTCSDGSIDLIISGSSGPFTFVWNTGATTEDLTGLAPGTYFVTVTDAWGCTETDSVIVSFSTLQNLSESQPIKIFAYPNPNSGKFNIDYDLGQENTATMVIYNLVGQRLKTIRVNQPQGTLQMDISAYKQGIYFVRVETPLAVRTMKIVLEK